MDLVARPAFLRTFVPGDLERPVPQARPARALPPAADRGRADASGLAVGVALAIQIEVVHRSEQARAASLRPVPAGAEPGPAADHGPVVDGEARILSEAPALPPRSASTRPPPSSAAAARARAARAILAYRRGAGGGPEPSVRSLLA